jgi:hypothetical protein
MATVQIIVTDQGNGGSFCSDCGHCLDGGCASNDIPKICPKCKSIFTETEKPWFSPGGMDFLLD